MVLGQGVLVVFLGPDDEVLELLVLALWFGVIGDVDVLLLRDWLEE